MCFSAEETNQPVEGRWPLFLPVLMLWRMPPSVPESRLALNPGSSLSSPGQRLAATAARRSVVYEKGRTL